jgi:hypothetical protein
MTVRIPNQFFPCDTSSSHRVCSKASILMSKRPTDASSLMFVQVMRLSLPSGFSGNINFAHLSINNRNAKPKKQNPEAETAERVPTVASHFSLRSAPSRQTLLFISSMLHRSHPAPHRSHIQINPMPERDRRRRFHLYRRSFPEGWPVPSSPPFPGLQAGPSASRCW